MIAQISSLAQMSPEEARTVARAKSYDEDLIGIAELKHGPESSEYAAAQMDKVKTLVAMSHEDS